MKVFLTATFSLLISANVFAQTAVEISRVPQYGSQYDSWTIKANNKYVQFRCENQYIASENASRDRIWRRESSDGISNWTNDQIVIEGQNTVLQDDLSCSPGVVIDPATNLWHLYYVTASRFSECSIEMWHAISTDGYAWTKLGTIAAIPQTDCSLVEPSPVIENGKVVIYFPADWKMSKYSTLWRMEAEDSYASIFKQPTKITSPNLWEGRVTLVGNTYYLAYSFTLDGTNHIPDVIYLTSSTSSPPSFSAGIKVAQATPGTFYSTQIVADNYLPVEQRLYISGNYMPLCITVTPPAVCANYPNAIGVLLSVPINLSIKKR